MRGRLIALSLIAAWPVAAETWVPVRVIRPAEVIGPADLSLSDGEAPGAYLASEDITGLEARVILYPGRPIRHGDVGPPATIERNEIVELVFHTHGLTITADGRALGRGAIGDRVRVMNLDSRTTVTGQIADDGTVHVKR